MKVKVLAMVALLAVPSIGFAEDAAAVYKTKCAGCHGATGAGDSAVGKKLGVKPLNSAEGQKKTDAELKTVISKGNGKMPAFGGKIADGDIDGLVAFIRTLKK